jgi:hypothetical protein
MRFHGWSAEDGDSSSLRVKSCSATRLFAPQANFLVENREKE